MSYLRWIKRCNTYEAAHFVPFFIESQCVGWVLKTKLDLLRAYPEVFLVEPHRLLLHPLLASPQARTQAVGEVLADWNRQHLLPRWYNEAYPVSQAFDHPPLMLIERAAVPFFGIRAYGIHLNGFFRRNHQIEMWISRRAYERTTYPGMLDNLVAGGQAAGHTPRETMIKECQEEANIPFSLASQAKSIGAISYCMETPEGIRRDVMFNYDLELPLGFQPENTDGEVAEFYRWPLAEVAQKVEQTEEFKTNCNLVILDFLVRHGELTPEMPEYVEIVQGLHSQIPDALF